MNKMNIVVCLDKDFVMPTGVMMYSVCVNNRDSDISFYIVIDESVSEVDKNDIISTLSEFNEIKCYFYPVSSQLTASFPLIKGLHITRAAYYRLFLTEILPSTIEKVLYLDGDLIIRHSLLSLWNLDLTGYAIGASIDSAEERDEIYDRLDYSHTKGHFNSGVMLINLSYWRTHNLIKEYLRYMKCHPERIKFVDQDVLNVVLQDKKYLIPVKYNFQTGFLRRVVEWNFVKYEKEVKEAEQDPVIVHYTDRNKPWLINNVPHPYRSTFLKYQRMTKWKDSCIDRRPLYVRIKNILGKYLRLFKIIAPVKTPYIEIIPID